MLTRKHTILALLKEDGVGLIDRLTTSIDRCRVETRPDMENNRSAFIELHGLRHSFDNVIRPAGKELEKYEKWNATPPGKRSAKPPKLPDLDSVADHIEIVCQRLELSLDDIADWYAIQPPWNMARIRDQILVIACEREVRKMARSHGSRRRLGFAHHDIIAYSRISDFVSGLGNRPYVRLVPVPHDLDPEEAWRMLRELIDQKPAGIISIGSANGNPISDVASRAVFDLAYDAPRDTESVDGPILPAHFVWAHEVRNDFLAYPHPKARSPGIRFVEPACEDLQREVEGNGTPDAGMMLLDARKRPFVCVLAGHGGLGTLAATESFLDTGSTAEKLRDSADLNIFHGMTRSYPDRVFNVIEVSQEPSGDREDWFEAPGTWEMETDVYWRYSFE